MREPFALLPPQNASGNWVKVAQRIPVRLAIDSTSEDPPLRAGMSAIVEIDSGFEGRLSAKGLGKRLSKLWPHLESVFQARKERDGHTRTWVYTLQPSSFAGFAGFQEAFPRESPTRRV